MNHIELINGQNGSFLNGLPFLHLPMITLKFILKTQRNFRGNILEINFEIVKIMILTVGRHLFFRYTKFQKMFSLVFQIVLNFVFFS